VGNPQRNDEQHIYNECFKVMESFSYFLDKYVYIEDKESGIAIPFKLWPEQKRILPDLLYVVLLIMIKARQLGLTWLCAALALWLSITKSLQLTVCISAKEEWAIEFLDRVKFIMVRLPPWMVPPILIENNQMLRFDCGENLYSDIKSLTTTEEGAQSKTPTLLILDETARNRHIRSIFASSKPGIDAGGGRIIMISNSIKDGVGWFFTRGIYKASMLGLNTFKRVFLSWRAHPKRPADFIKRQINDGMDPQDVSWHYPATETEAISAVSGSYFGLSLAKHENSEADGHIGSLFEDNIGEIILNTDDSKGPVEVWRYPYNQIDGYDGLPWINRYAIGSDVSEGLGLSYSVGYVLDRLLDEIICRVRSNRIPAHKWAEILFNLSRYYDNALLCVERTGAGLTVVQILNEMGAEQYIETIQGKIGTPLTKKLGWGETDQKKHDLSEALRNWYSTTSGGFYCPYLFDESSTWIQTEGSRRLGPEDGALGDCVIAGGLTVIASEWLGGRPIKTKEPVSGWLKKIQKGE